MESLNPSARCGLRSNAFQIRPIVEGESPLRGGRYAVQSYLEHHGRKLARRFDPNSYLVLTEAMSSHDVGRGRGGLRRSREERGENEEDELRRLFHARETSAAGTRAPASPRASPPRDRIAPG